MKKSIIKLSVFIGVVLFLAYVWVPYSNEKKTKSESFKGVVLKKYYKRGNALDVRLESGKIYTPYRIIDSIYDKIDIGDTLEMRNGIFINLK